MKEKRADYLKAHPDTKKLIIEELNHFANSPDIIQRSIRTVDAQQMSELEEQNQQKGLGAIYFESICPDCNDRKWAFIGSKQSLAAAIRCSNCDIVFSPAMTGLGDDVSKLMDAPEVRRLAEKQEDKKKPIGCFATVCCLAVAYFVWIVLFRVIGEYLEPTISGALMILVFPYFSVSYLIYQANAKRGDDPANYYVKRASSLKWALFLLLTFSGNFLLDQVCGLIFVPMAGDISREDAIAIIAAAQGVSIAIYIIAFIVAKYVVYKKYPKFKQLEITKSKKAFENKYHPTSFKR